MSPLEFGVGAGSFRCSVVLLLGLSIGFGEAYLHVLSPGNGADPLSSSLLEFTGRCVVTGLQVGLISFVQGVGSPSCRGSAGRPDLCVAFLPEQGTASGFLDSVCAASCGSS